MGANDKGTIRFSCKEFEQFCRLDITGGEQGLRTKHVIFGRRLEEFPDLEEFVRKMNPQVRRTLGISRNTYVYGPLPISGWPLRPVVDDW